MTIPRLSSSANPPHLLVDRECMQFNSLSDYWLDVSTFKEISGQSDFASQPLEHPQIEHIIQAVAVFRGSFLEGFSLPDSAPFEEWVLLRREQLNRSYLHMLSQLADYFESCGEFEQAQQYVWHQIELEPWQEEAHRQLMRLLVLSGRRSEAMNRYEVCRNLLLEGLGVEPSRETRILYEQIRDGLLVSTSPIGAASRHAVENAPKPVFVGREKELSQLTCIMERVLLGHGHVLFVTGEAGIGKTALLREFSWRSLERNKALLVILGSCNAQPDIAGAYLPFIEAFHMLTGDIQSQWINGAISNEHVRRLRVIAPEVIKVILEVSPALLTNLVSASELAAFSRMDKDRHTLLQLDHLSDPAYKKGQVSQAGLFEQILLVLQRLARDHPILLVLDDLQWIDAASLSLLFYLGRRLAGSRILILGAYRQDELEHGRRGKRQTLDMVIHELQESFGDVLLDLSQTTSRPFVDRLVDLRPNRLGDSFREKLFHHTGGNPLFTTELLYSLAERGEIVQDRSRDWIEGRANGLEHLTAPG